MVVGIKFICIVVGVILGRYTPNNDYFHSSTNNRWSLYQGSYCMDPADVGKHSFLRYNDVNTPHQHTLPYPLISWDLLLLLLFEILFLQVLSAECRANFITVSATDVLSPWLVRCLLDVSFFVLLSIILSSSSWCCIKLISGTYCCWWGGRTIKTIYIYIYPFIIPCDYLCLS